MRPQIELQRVHDVLMNVLADKKLQDVVEPDLLRPMMMTVDCLCWALHHDDESHPGSHGSSFRKFIFELEQELMEKHGVVWGGPPTAEAYEVEEE